MARWVVGSDTLGPSLSLRYCTEGKRTFSSRLILEKHIRVQHGLAPQDLAARQV